MPITNIVLGVLVVGLIALVAANIRIVPQANAFVVERLGKYNKTWDAGIHVKFPVIDSVVKKISLKEQVLDFPPQVVITKDNVTIQIDPVVFAVVFDPKLYSYGVQDPLVGLRNLSATTLRNIVGKMDLDDVLSGRDQINSQLQAILDEGTDPWGIRVGRVEIRDVTPPANITDVMTAQMRAERERRQDVLQAEAYQQAATKRAAGDREAQILRAEGEAQALRTIYAAQAEGLQMLKNAGADETVLRLRAMETMAKLADGQASKIFFPTDLMKSIGALGVGAEALGMADKTIY